MDWFVKNAKVLIGLLVASLVGNAGMSLWLAKTEKKLTAMESAYATPQPVNTNIQNQNLLSVLNQMNQRLGTLAMIAMKKDEADKKAIAAERKFYHAPLLKVPSDSETGTGPQ